MKYYYRTWKKKELQNKTKRAKKGTESTDSYASLSGNHQDFW